MAFCSAVITVVSSLVHGPPELAVQAWGVVSFNTFAIALYSLGTALAVLVLTLLLRRRGLGFSSAGFVGSLTLKGSGFALAGLAVAFTLYPTIEALLKPLGVGMFWGSTATSYLRSSTGIDLALTLSLAILIGPIAEEVVFRGYLLTAFVQRKMNLVVAYLLSALIFTSAHVFVGPGTMVFIFFWSFIPAFLLLRFGNLYPGILFHILNNFVTYIVFPMWILG